jgi:hypothetical protein
MKTDYVSQREAELKAKYEAEMWWIRIGKAFALMGKAMALKRDADYYAGEWNAIRSQFIKRGRKAAA